MLGTSPGTRRARRSSRSARPRRPASPRPSSTPSGANTELQEWAKLLRKLPPQDSPLAFSSSTPSIVAAVAIGNSVDGLTAPASSAAAVVTILNVEPGGWGAEKAMPASARISAVARVERGDAAEAPGQRGDGRLLKARVDRRAHGLRGHRLGPRDHTPPRQQSPARTPGELGLERLLQAALPDRPAAREAPRVERAALLHRSPRPRGCPRSSPRSPRAVRCVGRPGRGRAPCRRARAACRAEPACWCV